MGEGQDGVIQETLECLCVFDSVCADANICVEVLCPLLQKKKKRKEKKEDFVRSTRLEESGGGGYGHREKSEHQALLLFSALGCVTSSVVSHRSVE